ncbi:MAG: transposase family protein, partial [bacterium]|nr:transposase family protein [bacterium]
MTVNKFIQIFLRLKGLFVCSFHFRIREKALDLHVKPYKNGRLCSVCKRRCKIVWILKERSWRDVVVCKWTVYFKYNPREMICPTHGRKQEKIPWADAHSRITYRLEYLMLVYCQIMTQKAAAMLLGFSTSTLSNH